MHLNRVQAKLAGQSALLSHSRRHPCELYGSPSYPSEQTQAPAPLYSRHSALRPQGDGEHGLDVGVISVAKNKSLQS